MLDNLILPMASMCVPLSLFRPLWAYESSAATKRPPVCSEIISLRCNSFHRCARLCYCMLELRCCCWTETIDKTYLRTSFGPRGRTKKAEGRSWTLLRVTMQPSFSFSHSAMRGFTHLLKSTFTKYKKMHIGAFDSMLSGCATRGIK